MKNIIKRLEEIRWEDAKSPKWWVNFVKGQIRLYFYIARETVRDKCMRQAAALTFTTLLAIIPLFAVAFSVFRGFVASEGFQKRAERTILRTMLAVPSSTGNRLGTGWSQGKDSLPETAELSAEELVEKADKLPRMSGAHEAAKLYIAAFEKGADVHKIRDGLSSLYFGTSDQVWDILKINDEDSYDRYLKATGNGEKGGGRPHREGAYKHFGTALTLADRLAYEDALEELKKAETAGYPSDGIRAESARIYLALGDRQRKERKLQDALNYYRQACLLSTDAMVISANSRERRSLSREGVTQTAEEHNDALQARGGVHLALGDLYYQKYIQLIEANTGSAKDPERTCKRLKAAIEHYESAAYYLENSQDAHLKLAEALWSADKKEEARTHYKIALEKRDLTAAKDFSVAITEYVRRLSRKASTAGLGVVGVLALVFTAISLLNTIEKTLNEIWQVTEKRKLWIKFTEFCTLIWLGPALIAVSILVREKLAHQMEAFFIGMPVLDFLFSAFTTVGRYVLPFITVWLLLLALYKFLPHTRVKIGAACWGAFVGTVLVQLARPGFGFYVSQAMRYEKLYGSLAAFPVFLLWLWLLWMLVLFGAEVAFTVQNLGLLQFQDKQSRLSQVFIDRYLAARIMMYVGREFWQHGRPMDIDRLAETLQIPVEEATDAVRRLIRLGYLTPIGEEREAVHPAKDLSNLTVMEILSITDQFRDDSRSTKREDCPYEGTLEKVFNDVIHAQENALEGLTFADLMRRCEKQEERKTETTRKHCG
jgi:membrane protein